MQEQEIIDRIRNLYPDAVLEASGKDCSFEVYVVTAAFTGMGPLQRQQSVLKLFSGELQSGQLHALGVKAKTPEEFSRAPNNLAQLS